MKVTARIAAKIFLRRFGRPPTSARRWFPIALRWRRTPRATRAEMRPVGTPFVAQSWFTQFHMHFAVAAASVHVRSEKIRSIHHSAAMWRPVQPIASRRAASSVPVLPPHDRPNASLVHRVVERERSHRTMMMRQSTSHFSSHLAERTTVTRLKFRQERTPRTVPPAAMEAPGPVQSPRRHIAPVSPAIARMRSKALVRTPPKSEPRPQLPAICTPELAWRKPERNSPEAAPERASGPALRSFAARPGASFASPPPQSAWQTQSVVSARPFALDSATVDRLAEDVMRRVERHIRIERERRGV